MEKTRKMELQPLIELGIFLFALLGTIIPLHIHLDNKMDVRQKQTNEIVNAIRQDMRDFHDKLLILEERNRRK